MVASGSYSFNFQERSNSASGFGETVAINSAILGGVSNHIFSAGTQAVVFGGNENRTHGSRSGILGGLQNFMGTGATNSAIIAGNNNSILSPVSAIVAGRGATAFSTAFLSGIVGGENSVTHAAYSGILGGLDNFMGTGGTYSAIIGGKGLIGTRQETVYTPYLVATGATSPTQPTYSFSQDLTSGIYWSNGPTGATALKMVNIGASGATAMSFSTNYINIPSLASGSTATRVVTVDQNGTLGATASVPILSYSSGSIATITIYNLGTTPLELIAAPGANKIIQVLDAMVKLEAVSGNFTTNTTLTILQGGQQESFTSNCLASTQTRWYYFNQTVGGGLLSNIQENAPVRLSVSGGDPLGTTSNTIRVYITYRIVDV